MGYVLSRGDGQMTRTRYHVMRHVQRVQQHWSLTINEAQLDALAQWAQRANAIVFLPDGGIRDPQGRVLLSAGGAEAGPGAALPYPDQAWQRKARTEAELAARNLSPSASLPPLISEPELRQRTPQEIAERAFALLAVAVRAESMASGEALPPDTLLQRLPSAEAALTPKERAFLFDQAPTQSEVAQVVWRYECLAVLQWAMGLLDVLPFPDAICDVPAPRAPCSMPRMSRVSWAPCACAPTARSWTRSICTIAFDWLVRQAQLKELPVPEGLDGGVVVERHYALNWLVRFEDSAWDEVDTPT